MAWQAVHPDSTTTIGLPQDEQGEPVEGAVSFEIGFWPPREAERFNTLLAEMRAPDTEIDPIEDQDKWLKSVGLDYELTRDMIAYSCRGWSGMVVPGGETIEPEMTTETIDGIEHHKLTTRSIRVLHANRLFALLGLKCWLFNVLDEEKKREFGLRLVLPSSKSPTDVSDATPNGKATSQPVDSSETSPGPGSPVAPST